MAGNGSGSTNHSIHLFNATKLNTTELNTTKLNTTEFNTTELNATELFANETIFEHDEVPINLFTDLERYTLAAVYATISVLGVTLNILAIFVFVAGRRTGKGIRIQLVNLAVSDILQSLTAPAYALHLIIAYPFPSNLVLCGLVSSISYVGFSTSMIWHATISIERFVIVYFPIRASRYKTKHKLMVASVVWICGFLLSFQFVIYVGLKTKKGITFCVDTLALAENDPIEYASNLISQSIPLVTITIVMYFLISVKLVRRKIIGERIPSSQPRKTVSNSQKVLLMLFVDGIFTVILSIPDITDFFMHLQAGAPSPNIDKRIVGVIRLTIYTVTLTNCYSSPIIYFTFNPGFRKDMKELFYRICRKKSPYSASFQSQSLQTIRGFSSRHESSSLTESPIDSPSVFPG